MHNTHTKPLFQKGLTRCSALLFLLSALCPNNVSATSENLQETLNGSLSSATLGSIPVGWKVNRGDWAVKLDRQFAAEGADEAKKALTLSPQAEKENLLPRVLGTDLEGGTIRYTNQAIADFTLTYEMKHATERDFWVNGFQFRIQPKGECYSVRHERFGPFTLLRNGKEIKTSAGKLDVDQGEWLWIRVKAEGKRILVSACTDGMTFLPYIDVTDEGGINEPGTISFTGPRRFRFAFLENPWDNDAKKLAKGAFLVSAQQGDGFRQITGAKSIQTPILVEYFVADPAKAPTSITISCDGKSKTIQLERQTIGYHKRQFLAEVLKEGSTGKVDLVLNRAGKAIDHATAVVTNPWDPAKQAQQDARTEQSSPQSMPVTKADYMACLDKIFDHFGNDGKMPWDNRFGANAILYRAMGDQKYLDRVMEWGRRWIKDRETGKLEYPDFNFSNRDGFANAATLALQKGNFTPEEKKVFLAIVADVLANGFQEGGGVMNRAMGYAVTLKSLLDLVPDHPMRKQVLRFRDGMMSDFMATKEILENSSNYLPITALFMITWIDDNGLQELYKDPKVIRGFRNLVDMMDPSGGFPQFADYGGKDLYDWMLVAVFQRLATVNRDGEFQWAAHQMARHLIANFKAGEISGKEYEAIAFAYLYSDDSIPEVRPSVGSVVLSRNSGRLSKLILRSGWEQKDFFAAVDLLSGCEHGDSMALSLISVYNDGGQSLIDKAGRDISNHSLPLVRESSEDIPYARQKFEWGRWHHASYDLKLFGSWGAFSGGAGSPVGVQYLYGDGMIPYYFTYHPDREFAFVLGLNGNGKTRLYLDDVRLVKSGDSPEKPAKVLMLEDFEGPAYRWIGNFSKSDGAANGKSCGRFDVDFSESSYIGKKFPMPLYVYGDEYDRIEFWYKLEPVTGDISGLVLSVGDKSGTPRNFATNLSQNHPVKEKFFRDGKLATFAGFTLHEESPFGGNQTREREFLFVKNKVLWIRDRITPDPKRPYAAGPIWQVGKLSGDHGANWFDTWIDTNLLLWFVPKSYAAIEAISDPQPKGFEMGYKSHYPAVLTQYATGTEAVKKPLVFDTLLQPHSEQTAAAPLAASIKVLHDQDDITLISVDGDLLLYNPSGKEVSFGDLVTDCMMLYVTKTSTDLPTCESEGGSKVIFKGKALSLSQP
jgi:hypothetical protein